MGISRGQKAIRFVLAGLVSLVMSVSTGVVPAQAASERALYLYYTHTKETARIVFKRNGQYVQSGLNELNRFLRDWRRNEPTKMDPRLFDLVWEVYQEVGASQPINIVSAYRSPATNEALRSKSSGVAENSQHTKGNAMDFFIPGIPLNKLRAVAMRKQVGGVGYYPTSGSPFVHLDTGSVRAWPRMTRAQLKELFPDGKTMHLPTDGTPLSQQGYQLAMAEWKRCHAYPCNGSSSGTRVASSEGGGSTLMDLFFGGKDDQPAPAAAAPQARVETASLAPQSGARVDAPFPMMRPASLGGAVASADVPLPFSTEGSAPLDASTAPVPLVKSERLRVATASALPAGDAVTAIAALTAPVPQPRLIMTEAPSAALTAYAPVGAPEPGAQRALEMIINGAPATPAPMPTARLAALPALPAPRPAEGGDFRADPVADMFRGTFSLANSAEAEPLAVALADHVAGLRPVRDGVRKPDLVAPDLEHVTEVLSEPVALTSAHFAVIFDHDEADFDPTPEMGRFVTVMAPGDQGDGLDHRRFTPKPPLAVASN